MQPGSYPPPPGVTPAGPPPGAPAAVASRVRPSAWWFGVAGAVAVAGVVIAVVLMVRAFMRFQDRVEDFTRGQVPVTLEVEITDTGGYSIYHEYPGADDGRFSFGPEVSVTDPSGGDVPLERYSSSVTYTVSGHEGVGLYTFDADEPGTYEVTATGDTGTGIAVGRGVGRGLVGGILGGMAVGFVGVVAGVVLAIVVGVKRSRSRRALLPPPPFSGWGAPPPPFSGWGAPPPPSWPGAPPAGSGGPGAYGPGGPGAYGPGGPGGYGPGGPGGYGPGPVPPPPSPPPSPPAPAGWPPSDAPPSPRDAGSP